MTASGGRRLYAAPGPLGITPITPRAVVTFAEIDGLLAPLDLAEPIRLKLRKRTRTIMSDYMGPIVEASNHVSHAKSLKKVGAIGNAASSLAEMIETIEPAVLVQLDQLREDTDGLNQKRGRLYFDFLHLARQLRDLALVAGHAQQIIKANKVGHPARAALKDAVEALVKATVDATHEQVLVVKSKPPRFDGPGGEYIRRVFQHFDPTKKEVTLANIVLGLSPKAADKDRQSGGIGKS